MNLSILISLIIILAVLLIIILIYHKKFKKYREDLDEWLLQADDLKELKEDISKFKQNVIDLEIKLDRIISENKKIEEIENNEDNKLNVIQWENQQKKLKNV